MKKKLLYTLLLSSIVCLSGCGNTSSIPSTNATIDPSTNTSATTGNITTSLNPTTNTPTTNTPSTNTTEVTSTPTTNTPSTNTTTGGGSSSTTGSSSTATTSSSTTVVPPIEINGQIEVQEAKGIDEGVYVEFSKLDGAESYDIYYAMNDSEEYTKVDGMLIREYPGYIRVDVIGLKAGTYKVKIVPVQRESQVVESQTVVSNLVATAYNREGFAFNNNQVPGAYKLDGTLKANAVVLYVTNANKDSISLDVASSSKGATTNYVGLQNILNGFKKGYDSRPLDIRLIGKVTDLATMDKGDIVIDGGSKHNAGVTLEGIGEDAVAFGWGIRVKGGTNVEIRNIATMACDSDEGDNIGLQQDNQYVWVHHNDFFYGHAGGDADQAKGDGALDCKKSNYITFSYNHFWDTGKSNLLGNNGGETGYLITYHHNYYDHSDSRHPRVREYSAHVYNNYYDGVAKYGIGSTQGGSVFSEGNYFRNTRFPMLMAMQGSDIANNDNPKGTFSGEDGGIIKSFNNYMVGEERYITYQQNPTQFDAYEAASRDEQIPATVKTTKGSHTYDNFDTDATKMYSYNIQTPEEAKDDVIANAGRINGGDFKWTFDNTVEDKNFAVIPEFKAAIMAYESSIVKIGFGDLNNGGSSGGGSDTPIIPDDPSGGTTSPITESVSHNFTTGGLTSTVFTFVGNLSSSKGTVNYNGLTLTQCLKMESSTRISFETTEAMTLVLVFNEGETRTVKVNGTKYNCVNGIVTLDLAAGAHVIEKGDSLNLFYIALGKVE